MAKPTIVYDVITRSVLVSVGMNFEIISGPFESRLSAISAAETLCLEKGWVIPGATAKL